MATEHELDRTRTQSSHADFDVSDVEPNRATPSSQLSAPSRPWTSGILHRKARDGNGVADNAESAVATASGSSGMSLPMTLMRKFESSLGADLSGVRVHTGAESQAAAEAVGARAYTIGNDVHFGAGQFDPSSSGGEHLLAHEVAHTVQQAGSTPTRQNKLEVSSPVDSAEHEADRAADAMVSGASFAVSRSASSVSRAVHRVQKQFPTPGWGGTNDGSVTFNPNASVSVGEQKRPYWFSASTLEQVEVTPDSRGTVVLNNPFYWNYHEIVTTPGHLYDSTSHKRLFGGPVEANVTATYTVDKEGKITFSTPMKNAVAGVAGVFDGQVDAVTKEGAEDATISVSTTVKSTRAVAVTNGATQEHSANIGVDVKPDGKGVGGGLGGGGSISQQVGVTTTGAGQLTSNYGLVFKVKKDPATTKKEIQKIEFDQEGKFLSGNGGIDGVNAWWFRIPEPVRKQIMLGKKDVFLYGNASRTGTSEHNQTVVKNRNADVQKKLHELTPGMVIHPSNTGSVANEKSVVIEVSYTTDEAKPTP